MPVKYWSRAGLVLTTWCNARCASCYLQCGPGRDAWMTAEQALCYWRLLQAASPHGCRVHLSGGEPFGNWPLLLEVCRRAQTDGLGPLEKVETNGFWATDEADVRRRLRALDEAGMQKLSISADPYHQQYVPIERVRLLARTAGEVLGPQRTQVRWRDWLKDGRDTAGLAEPDRRRLFVRYASGGRDRMNGRAAELLGERVPGRPAEAFAAQACSQSVLRGKHVHILPGGYIQPGTCAGLLVGRLGDASAAEAWADLVQRLDERPVLRALARGGPWALRPLAEPSGWRPRQRYASRCHLCWDIRRHLQAAGRFPEELGPGQVSGSQSIATTRG